MKIVRYCSNGCTGHYSFSRSFDEAVRAGMSGRSCDGTGIGPETYPPNPSVARGIVISILILFIVGIVILVGGSG